MINTATQHPDRERMEGAPPMRNGPRNGVTRTGFVPPAEAARLRAGLGRLLAEARTAAGYSVRGLAYRSRLSPATVSRLERGIVRPRTGTLRVLAAALDGDEPNALAEQLIHAAGESIAADTTMSLRRVATFQPRTEAERWWGRPIGRCPMCGGSRWA